MGGVTQVSMFPSSISLAWMQIIDCVAGDGHEVSWHLCTDTVTDMPWLPAGMSFVSIAWIDRVNVVMLSFRPIMDVVCRISNHTMHYYPCIRCHVSELNMHAGLSSIIRTCAYMCNAVSLEIKLRDQTDHCQEITTISTYVSSCWTLMHMMCSQRGVLAFYSWQTCLKASTRQMSYPTTQIFILFCP